MNTVQSTNQKSSQIQSIEIVQEPFARSMSNEGVNRLRETFFNQPCIDLAKKLLGKILVRVLQDGTILKGIIVETESYLGGTDKASHSFNNKVTDRNEPMYMTPGTIYVYLTYGMYHILNISSKGDGAAVLIRAIQPIEGIDVIQNNRNLFNSKQSKKGFNKSKPLRDFELCNGPAKFTIGFEIDMNINKQDLSKAPFIWIEPSHEVEESLIVSCKRIGIDSVGPEWANKPLRFYIYGNKSVSKKDKVGESALLEKLK
uniref:DNA-3-methyladenine glycosylase n=1 Tax=Clastoptera arizonana TaxID=38151 RepID=A0A1B6CMF4_9HEMI